MRSSGWSVLSLQNTGRIRPTRPTHRHPTPDPPRQGTKSLGLLFQTGKKEMPDILTDQLSKEGRFISPKLVDAKVLQPDHGPEPGILFLKILSNHDRGLSPQRLQEPSHPLPRRSLLQAGGGIVLGEKLPNLGNVVEEIAEVVILIFRIGGPPQGWLRLRWIRGPPRFSG